MNNTKRFWGKYRGKVVKNVDPKKKGRIQISVPDVLDKIKSSWAEPCVPYAGKEVGLFLIPPIGANIWVEFLGGDINYPIWVGCYWGENELPKSAVKAEVKVLKTEYIELKLDNNKNAGGLDVKVEKDAAKKTLTFNLNSTGIKLDNESSSMTVDDSATEIKRGSQSINISSSKVAINKDALEVI